MQPIYILIALIALAIVAIFVVFKWKRGEPKKLSRLAGLSFAFIVAGLVFGDDRLIGYSFLGIGFILAVIDIVKNLKARQLQRN